MVVSEDQKKADLRPKRNNVMLAVSGIAGLVMVVLAIGFFLQQTWATAIWPWKASKLSNIYLSSIFAAIAAPMLWIAWSRIVRLQIERVRYELVSDDRPKDCRVRSEKLADEVAVKL